jgi:glycosyltransferase 2 family protein
MPVGQSESTAPGTVTRGNVLTLLIQPSGWRRIKLFAASTTAGHRRRRADGISLAWYVLALLVVVPTTRSIDGVEAGLAETVQRLPDIVAQAAAVPYDLLTAWAALVLILVLVRRHWWLLAGLLLGMLLAGGATLLLNGALDLAGAGDDLALGAPQSGVPVTLVIALTVVTIASRELSRPFRTLGRRLALAATLGAVAVPVTSPYRVLCAVLATGVVASLVRLALGSPRLAVSQSDIRHGLRDLGVEAEPMPEDHIALRPDGGRLQVRVMGRDEWESELMTSLWRLVWYRNSGTTLRLSPRQQIEHEAFLLLLAQSRGASVTPLVAAGVSRTGDALIATQLDGIALDELEPASADDALLDRAWRALAGLHLAGIAHGALRPAALDVTPVGPVRLGSFEQAQPITRLNQVHADRAQLLATTAIAVGPARAIAAALAALDPEDAAPLVANLQTAAMDGQLRRALDENDLDLAVLRASTADAAAIEPPELQKIWRVSWGAILRLALLGAVGYLLISQLADIGFDTIVTAIREATLPMLGFALLLGQLPRVAQAASLQAASPAPVPLERVTRLQFATCFISLAMPSTAARAAMSIRFFQRSGATPGGAVSAGALDSVFGFIAQMTLIGGFILAGFGTLGFDGLGSASTDRSGLWTAILIAFGLLLVVVAAVALIPKLRRPVVGFLGQLREALTVLRSPGAVIRLFGWNLMAELLFSLTLWTVLRAFGQDVSLIDAVIINVAVALFAGLVPVPGGVGVTEGALSAGFVAVGVPDEIAFSAALCYRMCTFYLPPIWGYVAYRSLRRDRFL